MLESAFGRPDESAVVERLRQRQALALSLVALRAELVVGHIVFTAVDLDPGGTPEWIEAAPQWLDAAATPPAEPSVDSYTRADAEVPWVSLEEEFEREKREAEAAAAEAAAQEAAARPARSLAVEKSLSAAGAALGIAAPRYMALGPMGVHPKHQKRGIGTRLVQTGVDHLARLGVEAVFVLGHPEYYPRFGFTPARWFGIGCEFTVRDDAFMVRELKAGSLGGVSGVIRYVPELSALG